MENKARQSQELASRPPSPPREPTGRGANELRPLSFEPGINRYAEGSVLVRWGHTQVLCTASVEASVPAWLQGKGRGWVTAEYAMLPRSTHTRGKREREKVSGRTHEIQRLIGRSLRAVVDLEALGERSILVDCDVLQADGGTRTAAISGAFVALAIALRTLSAKSLLLDTIAAVSVGMKEGQVLVDLDYAEDSSCDVDMNFVLTGSGRFVELQGTAERKPFGEAELRAMESTARAALARIRELQQGVLDRLGIPAP
jgi:ribonuclease PH